MFKHKLKIKLQSDKISGYFAMENCVINTLPLHNNEHIRIPDSAIIIQTIWRDDVHINLFVRNERKGFGGTLRKSQSTSTAHQLEVNFEQFWEETKTALCTENGLPNFTYILERSEASTTFKWVKSAGFRVIYGEVDLDDRPDAVEKILLDSISVNAAKDLQITTMRADIQRMEEDFNAMKIALEKCVDEKNKLESELLRKFAALLNAKKQKIAELESAIKNRSTGAFDGCESGSGDDSDLDYCSQAYVREKSPEPSTSIQVADTVLVPKRSKIKQTTNETIPDVVDPRNTTDSMDIYEQETQEG